MHIDIQNCSITSHGRKVVESLTWSTEDIKFWLITGSSKSKKNEFGKALCGEYEIVPNENGFYFNSTEFSPFIVSFETVQEILRMERKNDDSDFVEGGVDVGRTPYKLIQELSGIEVEPENKLIQSFGIGSILNRGLKYLSTGEIKRTLLCCAFLVKPDLLILDEPFDGLDAFSRDMLHALIAEYTPEKILALIMDSRKGIPEGIQGVVEFDEEGIKWCGPVALYVNEKKGSSKNDPCAEFFKPSVEVPFTQSANMVSFEAVKSKSILVEMKNVSVKWSDRKILDEVTWTLNKGEHWLIRGPNGSGKTTFLELISGDNPQVYSNEVYLFGQKRGSGETLWDIRRNIGMVSWKLHNEYRYFGNMTVEQVMLSGLHDSIGLYASTSDGEKDLVHVWLRLISYESLRNAKFGALSYGDQRAVLILRAAIKLPLILILDEPCHGLDYEQQGLICELLEKIAKAGNSTLVHVTHNPDEVLSCEKHILELCPGNTPMYRILKL